jgi:ubiquinol-cytochrome c reductase cytochrome b subunit
VKRFFPHLFAIEALVALGMLVALIVLSALTTAPLEEKASRDATGYVPRPEWYFLWLFQLLKYFKGSLEVVGTALVPVILIALLLAVPLLDRRPPKTRKLLGRTRPIRVLPRIVAALAIALLLTLTVVAASQREASQTTVPPPVPEWPPQSRGHDSRMPASHFTGLEGVTRGSHVRVA